MDLELTLLLLSNNNNKNPHHSFLKGTVLGDKEQGVGIRDKKGGIRENGQGSKPGRFLIFQLNQLFFN